MSGADRGWLRTSKGEEKDESASVLFLIFNVPKPHEDKYAALLGEYAF